MHCDALKTEGMTAVRDKRVSDHGHTYRTREVVLRQSQQLSHSNLQFCVMLNTIDQLLCCGAHFTANSLFATCVRRSPCPSVKLAAQRRHADNCMQTSRCLVCGADPRISGSDHSVSLRHSHSATLGPEMTKRNLPVGCTWAWQVPALLARMQSTRQTSVQGLPSLHD